LIAFSAATAIVSVADGGGDILKKDAADGIRRENRAKLMRFLASAKLSFKYL